MSDIRESKIPHLLQEIPDTPKKLYVRGSLPSPDLKLLTVVGSRKYTEYGRAVCEKLIHDLAGYQIGIVSGLALGIDAIAHRAALAAGLPTYAFPGSGISDRVLYPAQHRGLAADILTAGGGLISEFEPDVRAARWTFPQRNRLMAGIAHATLVIEAENKSGTRITAALATQYNREVLAVPGSILSSMSEGTNQLIREGATPVTSAEHIVEALGLHVLEEKQKALPLDLSTDEHDIMIVLQREPTARETLARQLEKPIHALNVTISLLEIKGLVVEREGKLWLS